MSIFILRLGVLLLCIGIIWIFACEDKKPPEPEDGGYSPADIAYIAPDSASVAVGPSVELIWHAFLPAGPEAYHSIYTGFSESELEIVYSTMYDDTSITRNYLEPGQVLYWKIVGHDNDGNDYEGPVWFFEVVGNQTSYIYPDSASSVVGPDVELIWHKSPLSGAYEYWVYYGPDADDFDGFISTAETTATISELYPPDTTYWKVWTLHDNGTDVGPIWFFDVMASDERTVHYISPDSASMVEGPDVELIWHRSTNSGWPFMYGVATGPSEDDLELYGETAETTITVTDLYPPDTVYWEVISWDGYGTTNIGPTWFFGVTEEDVEIPQNPDPPDGWTSVSVSTNLSWDYSGTPSDVIYCDVYLGSSPDPGLVSDNLDATTYDPPQDLEYDVTYYWKIVAFTSPSDSTVGPVWSFTTEQEEDVEMPQNPDPPDNAISVSVATNLSWEYSGTPSDVIYCDVYLGTTPDPGLVSDNLDATTYDPPENLEYGTAYYWKIVAFTSPADSVVGPVWTFSTQIIVEQDIYAQFKLTADILMPFFSWDVITARFDSSYAPDGPIDTLQADSVTVNGNLMNWNSFMGNYSYQEDPSLHWLVEGGAYTFDVYGNAQVPDLTLQTTWLECSPMITYPTSADTIYNSGFTTTWDGVCAGNVILTFVLNGTDTTDVRIETPNDGEYTFTEEDLAPLQGFSGVISEVIILRESYYIDEPGYQALSEVIMWCTHTVTTIIE